MYRSVELSPFSSTRCALAAMESRTRPTSPIITITVEEVHHLREYRVYLMICRGLNLLLISSSQFICSLRSMNNAICHELNMPSLVRSDDIV